MINMNIIHSFGQTILDSKSYKANIKASTDPDEDQLLNGCDDDCDQCEIEKLKKPCTICEQD